MNKFTRRTEQNAQFEVSLKVILKNAKGEILLLRMPPRSTMDGYYDLVGGRIKAGEELLPLEVIIRREIKEELGNMVKYRVREMPVAASRHIYYSKKLRRQKLLFWVFFEARYISGRIQVSPEHAGYVWARLSQANLRRYFIRGPLEGMQNYFAKRFVRMKKWL